MTSGEWDLRALEALEAEEEKEFLRLSQTNLLEPPPPPAAAAVSQQLHALLPPTINESQRNAAAAASTRRLKFTRALSLSAHSLKKSASTPAPAPATPKYSKSYSSLSPPHCNAASLLYTPPPIRRCATLHHAAAAPPRRHCTQPARRSDNSPQLQRIGGTNKTYWKYGANSTAASIVGEARRLKRARNNNDDSDDLGSEEAAPAFSSTSKNTNTNNNNKSHSHSHINYNSNNNNNNSDDSFTDNGSCSVPLATDSIEMMRLMLSAATTAVSGAIAMPANPALDISAATSGVAGAQPRKSSSSSQSNASRFFSLARYPPAMSAARNATEAGETVAYEAFQQTLSRRKSFSGAGLLLRGQLNRVSNSRSSSRLQSNSTTATAAVNSNGNNMLLSAKAAAAAPAATRFNHFAKPIKCGPHDPLLCGSSMGVRSVSGYRELATQQQQQQQQHAAICFGSDVFDDELEQHIKHCACSCNHMGYGNSMDYQTTGFGGLPDVTEHSNIRRTLSRQNSISNSDSGAEISSIQKTKSTYSVDVKSAHASAAMTTAAAPPPPSSSSAAGAATLQRKKHKAAHSDNAAAATDHYKSRRATCVFGLILLLALGLLAVAATLAAQHFFMAPSRNSLAQRLRIVRRVLQEVPLVDGHNNFAWNVRKYAHSSLELVHLSHDLDHKSMWTRPTWAQTDMERLKQGLMGVQVWSAFVPCEAQGLDAVQLALEQIDIIRRFADLYAQDTLLVTSSKDLAAARRRGLMASLIGIEGGHAIGSSLGVLRSFYSLGARYLSLTHKCDVSWAGSSSSAAERGLSQFGKAIVREMNRLGMMIDLSYSSDATARDVLQATRAPVIFSHSAARQLCNATRNIPDDILRLLAENGGLIMVSFDSEDVACGRQAHLADVVAHIKYIRSIAGVQHIGLGAGYDSIEQPPVGLEDVSKYPDLLATLLEDHNWSEEDVAMLAGRNFLRILETVENVRDYWKRAAIQPVEQTEPQPKTQCAYMSS